MLVKLATISIGCASYSISSVYFDQLFLGVLACSRSWGWWLFTPVLERDLYCND